MAARRQRRLLEPGTRAPEFNLPRLDGGESDLGGLISSGLAAIAFFKVTCPVCQLAFPFLERLHAAGFRVYGISQNDPDETRDFNREFGITFPMLLDAEESGFPVSNAYGISSVPTTYVIEPGGLIARVSEGWVKSDIEWLGSQAGIRVIRPDERVPVNKPG